MITSRGIGRFQVDLLGGFPFGYATLSDGVNIGTLLNVWIDSGVVSFFNELTKT
jgi:hypothetical protein